MGSQAPLIVALVATATLAHADERYTLADVEALVAGKSFREAYDHLGDIAPAQRTAKWLELATAASTGLLATLPADDATALAAIDTMDREYPPLLTSAKYLEVRGKLGVPALGACYRTMYEYEPCAKLGVRLVDGDRRLALDVAGVTAKHNPIEAVSLFERADRKLVCKHEALPRVVVAGIGRPNATAAKTLMTACWAEVKDAVVEAFDAAGKKSAVYANTCPTLEAKRMLSSLQRKRCQK